MKGGPSQQSFVASLYGDMPVRHAVLLVTGLLSGSIVLSYLFQEVVLLNHCFSKLGIIFMGNLLFWAGSVPLVNHLTLTVAGRKGFWPLSIAVGAGLLVVNQLAIKAAIFYIFRYGFGCIEGVSNATHMLFENNILTSGIIYLIILLVLYHRSKRKLNSESVGLPASAIARDQLPVYRDMIVLKNNGSKLQLDVKDISYIEAKRNTLLIFTGGKKYVLYQSMISLEKELDPLQFVKIHRSFLVNRHFIHSYASAGNGNQLVTLQDGTELLMTRHYKSRQTG